MPEGIKLEGDETVVTNATMETVPYAELLYARIKGTNIAFSPIRDRMIVEEDTFVTGYECKGCNGYGEAIVNDKVYVKCPACRGTKKKAPPEDYLECSTCKLNGVPMGIVVCGECKGTGGLIVLPEASKHRPSSGIVRAVGGSVSLFKVGDHVIYGNHTGYLIEFRKRRVVIKILREDEVMCHVRGVIAGDE